MGRRRFPLFLPSSWRCDCRGGPEHLCGGFGDFVWKPEGERHEFASGLCGASGTAIDNEGHLLRSNLHGDSMTKVDRKGQAKPFATSGLSGPVGIAID